MTMTDTLTVDFAGELYSVATDRVFRIGREGDVDLDENPYLHRNFLELAYADGLWWVANVGARLPASLTDERGLVRSQLAPGARLPLVFPRTVLTFGAGSTTYEFLLEAPIDGYEVQLHRVACSDGTTIAPTTFTDSQRLAILALAEPLLKYPGTGSIEVPTAVEAATRLGWAQTRFNRKLDNICDKLTKAGVRGLRGTPGASALNRRVTLVEYAVSTLLVTSDDLPLLEREARTNAEARRAAAQARRAGR